jgi:lysophospholipase L1-like esterase
MQHILVYGDSLTWGIVPGSRRRLEFERRWPRVLERALHEGGTRVHVIEDALNGRRTVWDDPFKPGRNGLIGFEQRIEVNSPLSLVILMLGTNDFQSVHSHDASHSAQGVAALVRAVRRAPIEPGMSVPPVLVVAPPPLGPAAGEMTEKFAGGEARCVGVATAFRHVAEQLDCAFFDAGTGIRVSAEDGVHLDADQHECLGRLLAPVVAPLLLAT